ncbi:unnamed protein product [Prorocentrum cordatum]|uniref:Uncharacterized protein n=1 Tax=Prorocentrum cordatum TaxID=2364126 RepID=A0ABN9W0C7_9DINO|nr:unnamed protein product [Polarella glacialis]
MVRPRAAVPQWRGSAHSLAVEAVPIAGALESTSFQDCVGYVLCLDWRVFDNGPSMQEALFTFDCDGDGAGVGSRPAGSYPFPQCLVFGSSQEPLCPAPAPVESGALRLFWHARRRRCLLLAIVLFFVSAAWDATGHSGRPPDEDSLPEDAATFSVSFMSTFVIGYILWLFAVGVLAVVKAMEFMLRLCTRFRSNAPAWCAHRLRLMRKCVCASVSLSFCLAAAGTVGAIVGSTVGILATAVQWHHLPPFPPAPSQPPGSLQVPADQRANPAVGDLEGGVRRLNFDEAMPPALPAPPARLHCPVVGCPCSDTRRHPRWATLPTLCRHLDAHLSGQLHGHVEDEWLRQQGRTRCRACGLCVAARRGVHASCRPADRAAARPAAPPVAEPGAPPAGQGVGGRPSLDIVHAAAVSTPRYAPERARPAWSRTLSRCLANAAVHNSASAWTDLQMVAKCVLCVPPRTGRKNETALAAFTLERLAQWEARELSTLWREACGERPGERRQRAKRPPTAEQRPARAAAFAAEGLLGKGCAALAAAGLATPARETALAFERLHPAAPALPLGRLGQLVAAPEIAPNSVLKAETGVSRVALRGGFKLLGASIGDQAYCEAFHGLRRMEAHVPGAYMASLAATRDLCAALDPAYRWAPEDASTRAGQALFAYNARLPGASGARPETLEGATQKGLSAALDDHDHKAFCVGLSESDLAEIQSEQLPGASGFLKAPPKENLGLLVEPEEFVTAVKRRLLVPVYESEHYYCPCCDGVCDRPLSAWLGSA